VKGKGKGKEEAAVWVLGAWCSLLGGVEVDMGMANGLLGMRMEGLGLVVGNGSGDGVVLLS